MLSKEKEDTYNTLTPICCKYCKFITYIEFDMELHLFETHNIRSHVVVFFLSLSSYT